MSEAVFLPVVPASPEARFKCAKYSCVLTAAACIQRQTTRGKYKGESHGHRFEKKFVPLRLQFCASGECEQGAAIAAACGAGDERQAANDSRASSPSEEEHGASTERGQDRALPESRKPERAAQERAEGSDHHRGEGSVGGDARGALAERADGGPVRVEPDGDVLRPGHPVQREPEGGALELAAVRFVGEPEAAGTAGPAAGASGSPGRLNESEQDGAVAPSAGHPFVQRAEGAKRPKKKAASPPPKASQKRRPLTELERLDRTFIACVRAATRELAAMNRRPRR